MITANEISARRVPGSRQYRRRQRLTVDWVKLHEPEVWQRICDYVESEQNAATT